MTNTTVFLDESGYTLSNLLDNSQPVFVLASHAIAEEESREIKQRFFGQVKASELKYGRLARRRSQQSMILDFLRHINTRRSDVRIAYVHKPFALMCKAVDWIIEPVWRKDGIDVNLNGKNLALANLFYYASIDLAGNDYNYRLLHAFQTLMERPCPESYTVFGDVLAERCRPTASNRQSPLRQILSILYKALVRLTPEETSQFEKENLDVTLAMTLRLMHGWKQDRGSTVLVHDMSTNMAKRIDIWTALTSTSVPEAFVGWDRRTMAFPIAVKQTLFVDSAQSPGIQLADVLAGSVSACLTLALRTYGPPTKYEHDLFDAIGSWVCNESIWPERKFTPAELNTLGPKYTDANDFVQSILDKV